MSELKRSIIKAVIINAIWSLAEIALIIWASISYQWAGFGISFGACFALRVILWVIDAIMRKIAWKRYCEVHFGGPIKGWDSLD